MAFVPCQLFISTPQKGGGGGGVETPQVKGAPFHSAPRQRSRSRSRQRQVRPSLTPDVPLDEPASLDAELCGRHG